LRSWSRDPGGRITPVPDPARAATGVAREPSRV